MRTRSAVISIFDERSYFGLFLVAVFLTAAGTQPIRAAVPKWGATAASASAGRSGLNETQDTSDSSGGKSASAWQYWEGRAEPDPYWKWTVFDADSWTVGSMPFHEMEGSDGTALTGIPEEYSSVFLRQTFDVSDRADIDDLRLDVVCSGGFVAWLNGVELIRYNMREGASFVRSVPYEELLREEAEKTNSWSIPFAEAYLVDGSNVLAVQACRDTSPDSKPFLLDLHLNCRTYSGPPDLIKVLPEPGSVLDRLGPVEVFFDRPVEGMDYTSLKLDGLDSQVFRSIGASQYVFSYAPAKGDVKLSWTAWLPLRDRSRNRRIYPAKGWNYEIEPSRAIRNVRINEVMTGKQSILRDEDGDHPDWIELFNGSDAPVDLTGFYLTDTPADLRQWQFPRRVISAHGYLLVFASGKSRAFGFGNLHTNFRLKDGEYLALTAPDGETITSEILPARNSSQDGFSYGAAPDDSGAWRLLETPTPGKPNRASGAGSLGIVQFNQSSGEFRAPFELVCSATNSGAVVRYTMDGSMPTGTSAAYSGTILIDRSLVIRARVEDSGGKLGPVSSACFVKADPTVTAFRGTLPVLLVKQEETIGISATQFQPGYCMLWEAGVSPLESNRPPALVSRIGIKRHGTSTASFPKPNLRMEFRDESDEDADRAILGMPADSDWVLYAPSFLEPVMIHNPFMYELSNELGHYAPRTRFVEVFLQSGADPLNSLDYQGIYVLTESVKRGSDRVDLPKLADADVNYPEITGGYLIKLDHLDYDATGFRLPGLPQPLQFVEPDEEQMILPQRALQADYLEGFLRRFQETLDSPNFADPKSGYAQYIDVGSWIDYHLLNLLAFNVDALGLSTYIQKPRNGKLAFGPIWDFDRALGSYDGRDANPERWLASEEPPSSDMFHFPWWGRLFEDPEFWQLYVDRWEALREREFSETHLFELIDRFANEVRPAQPREIARWPFFMLLWAGSYDGEVRAMKDWLHRRLEFIDGHFVAPPRFSLEPQQVPAGVPLGLATSSGTSQIYYTLDGSDPRAAGGGISPAAMLYREPLKLSSDVHISARSFDPEHQVPARIGDPPLTSRWSGRIEGEFEVVDHSSPSFLSINEYCSDAAAESAGRTAGASVWVELFNSSDEVADVSGYEISLAPGNSAVLPEGTRISANGFWVMPIDLPDDRGSQEEGTERILLLDRNGIVVDTLDVDPKGGNGCSQGRRPDGAETVFRLRPPTPNESNALERMAQPPIIPSIEESGPGRIWLTWTAVPGRTYQIESRPKNRTGEWTSFGDVIRPTTDRGIAEFAIDPDSSHAFRVLFADQFPRFASMAVSEQGSLTVTWDTIPGRVYRLEFTKSLALDSWLPLDYVIRAETSAESLNLPAPSSGPRFYRIVEDQ